MEDSRAGHSQFLVARSNKGDETIYRRILCLSAKQKPHRTAGRKVDTKFNSGETMNAYIGRLYHQVAFSAGIQQYSSSSRLVN